MNWSFSLCKMYQDDIHNELVVHKLNSIKYVFQIPIRKCLMSSVRSDSIKPIFYMSWPMVIISYG